jgi:hypothetical protein
MKMFKTKPMTLKERERDLIKILEHHREENNEKDIIRLKGKLEENGILQYWIGQQIKRFEEEGFPDFIEKLKLILGDSKN